MSDNKIIKCFCSECEKETNHEILYEKDERYDCYDNEYEVCYQVVRCCGCENISFRRVTVDLNNWIQDEMGYGEPSKTEVVFPSMKKSYKRLDKPFYLPEKVLLIYNETVSAIENNNYLLAAMGMRAIVEAVCKEKNVKGKNLEIQIENLKKMKLISESDCNLLHGVRFLGNEAVHEIESPRLYVIETTMKILEHLLLGVYVYPQDAEHCLKIAVSDYEAFKEIVKREIDSKKVGTQGTLSSFIDKDLLKRFVIFKELEKRYLDDVKKGCISFLKYIGSQTKTYNGRNVTIEVLEKIR